MSVTNQDKSSTASCSNTSKNQATILGYKKSGSGWDYDQPQINYDQTNDPVTGLPVFYDSLGTSPTFTNLAKNSA